MKLKIFITVACLLLAVFAWWFPAIGIDARIVTLLVLAALPWLPTLVSEVEIPGVGKITLREMQEAAKEASASQVPQAVAEPAAQQMDPNLQLVAHRIALEKRLTALAESHGLRTPAPLSRLITDLASRGIIDSHFCSALRLLADAGNRAAHGAHIEPGVFSTASQLAQNTIARLDRLIAEDEIVDSTQWLSSSRIVLDYLGEPVIGIVLKLLEAAERDGQLISGPTDSVDKQQALRFLTTQRCLAEMPEKSPKWGFAYRLTKAGRLLLTELKPGGN